MKYRLIHCTSADGHLTSESITFVDADDTTQATDFCYRGETVHFDGIIEAELPDGFPVGSSFQKN